MGVFFPLQSISTFVIAIATAPPKMRRRAFHSGVERTSSSLWWTSEADGLLDSAGDADLTALRFFESGEDQKEPEIPVDEDEWLNESPGNGFVRVFFADSSRSRLLQCKTSTTATELARMAGFHRNDQTSHLFMQTSAFMTRRLKPGECPLKLQNNHLEALGYDDITRIQDEGRRDELGNFVRFVVGLKPPKTVTSDRIQLSGTVQIKEMKVFSRWRKRFCVLSGTKLLIFPSLDGRGRPRIFHLAGGTVQEHRQKQLCLLLTSRVQNEKSLLMSYGSWQEYSKWTSRCQKAISCLPNVANLSCCSLEQVPEYLFLNRELGSLNLCCNFMKQRPGEGTSVGWIDDLVKFSHLQSLSLADNDLHVVPACLYQITSLTELNISKNHLKEIPPGIKNLTSLQTLQLHTNRLQALPEDTSHLKHLISLVISFNELTEIPLPVFELKRLQVFIATGNKLSFISDEIKQLRSLQHLDLRMNYLTSIPSDILMHIRPLVHLDVRDNYLGSVDISKMTTLQGILCGKNVLRILVLRGGEMTCVMARSNQLISLQLPQPPLNLVHLDVSRNSLTVLPDALCDLQKLEIVDASYNELPSLPARIFWNLKKLHTLRVDHNKLTSLPERIDNCQIETLTVHYNRIAYLPASMLMRLYKLRHLNVSTNALVSIPVLGPTDNLNNVEELYLSGNMLKESALLIAARYKKLRVLQIGFNKIKNLSAKALGSLTILEELNVAGNGLSSLPDCFDRLSCLVTLVAHTNHLTALPDFTQAKSLRYLDVGNNKLKGIPDAITSFSHLKYIDLSYNPQLLFDYGLLEALKAVSRVVLEGTAVSQDMSEVFPEFASYGGSPSHGRWTHGSAEYKGNKRKLASGQIKLFDFREGRGALYGILDGGISIEVPRILIKTFGLVLVEELERQTPNENPSKYMRYAFLSAHKLLGSVGRKQGASAAVCHIRKVPTTDGLQDSYLLTVGNVGHTEAVLCRDGQVHVLTSKHTVEADDQETKRLRQNGTFLTEENKVNGISIATRLLGCSCLSPSVIPCPFTRTVALTPDDEFLIIGCAGLWQYVSYNQAISESRRIKSPSAAAKRLRDLARSYGSTSNISVVIVRFHLEGIGIASIDKKFDVPLSPPRRSRYRWSMIGINHFSSDTASEISDVASLFRLTDGLDRSAASSRAGSLRSTRSYQARKDISLMGGRTATLTSQAEEVEVQSNKTFDTEGDEKELDQFDISENPFFNASVADSSALVDISATNPFVSQEASRFSFYDPSVNTSVVVDLEEAVRGLTSDMERVRRWTLNESDMSSVPAAESTRVVAGVKERAVSLAENEHIGEWNETKSTVHIPELDDLDRTLSLIDKEFDDTD
eukprot:m.76250 g.76250  ORF g.76250 m.76250 type:complete len:1352 (+) comp35977_c0_seq2:239-4294(+)